MIIQILTSVAGPAYSFSPASGDNGDGVVDVSDEIGKELIRAGFAEVPRSGPAKQTTTKKTPAKAEKTTAK